MQVAIANNLLGLKLGDLSQERTDFIVNAANGSLLGGGGVDGAIHREAGPELLEANRRLRQEVLAGEYLPTGEAAITKGFGLQASYVIHTVGPIWENRGDEEALLANCYRNALSLAYYFNEEMERAIDERSGFLSRDLRADGRPEGSVKRISFPSISTGVYRFPIDKAARVALETVLDFLKKHSLGEVSFVLFSEADFSTYQRVLENIIKE